MALRAEQLEIHSPEMGLLPTVEFEHPHQEGVFVEDEIRDISVRETQLFHGTLRIAGAIVKFTRESPHPDDIEDPIPIVIGKGYQGVKGAYHDLGHAVALGGKSAVTVGEGRFQYLSPAEQIHHTMHPELLAAMALHGVIKATKQQLDIEHCDAAGHSMGGCTVVDEAIHNPGDVRSVLLIASAGMDGHTLKSLLERSPLIAHDLITGFNRIPKATRRNISFKEFLHFALNPIRTSAEGVVVANRDIRSRVSKLRERGTKVGQLAYRRDGFFPIEKARENQHLVDEFREHPDETLGHLGPQIDPIGTSNILLEVLQDMHSR